MLGSPRYFPYVVATYFRCVFFKINCCNNNGNLFQSMLSIGGGRGEKTNWPCTCSVSLAGVVPLSKVSSLKLFPCCRFQGAAERTAATFRLSPRVICDYVWAGHGTLWGEGRERIG